VKNTLAAYAITNAITNATNDTSAINGNEFSKLIKVQNGKIQIGSIILTESQYETCMKTLVELSKEKYPEQFV